MPTVEFVTDLFSKLCTADNKRDFFRSVADDVDWQIMGYSHVSQHYKNKDEFIRLAFGKIGRVLKAPAIFYLDHIAVCGEMAVVEMHCQATAINEQPYNNVYCWLVWFSGQKIVKVRAYLDSWLVNKILDENIPAADLNT